METLNGVCHEDVHTTLAIGYAQARQRLFQPRFSRTRAVANMKPEGGALDRQECQMFGGSVTTYHAISS